jgi:hypothetical protein
MDSIEFAGFSEEEIEDEHKEYVSVHDPSPCDLRVTP